VAQNGTKAKWKFDLQTRLIYEKKSCYVGFLDAIIHPVRVTELNRVMH